MPDDNQTKGSLALVRTTDTVPEGTGAVLDVVPEGQQPEAWHPMPNEPALLYRYFRQYCYLGDNAKRRSIDRLAKQLGGQVSVSNLYNYTREWEWIRRAAAYDEWVLRTEQQARERAIAVEAQKWAQRRSEWKETEWGMAMALVAAAKQMIDWPLFLEVIESKEELTEQGVVVKHIIHKHPNDWAPGDIARFMELASKLARLSTGMDTERKRMKIDFNSLSDEELERLAQGDG